jgi:putative Mg2+ transporter-C (MgtC) family protein
VSLEVELKMAAKILLALIVGGFMGWDRKHLRPEAGIRTYAAVCLASCLFGSLSLNMSEQSERARIAAQVVSGIVFLGAGVIVRDQGKIAGLRRQSAWRWPSTCIYWL